MICVFFFFPEFAILLKATHTVQLACGGCLPGGSLKVPQIQNTNKMMKNEISEC